MKKVNRKNEIVVRLSQIRNAISCFAGVSHYKYEIFTYKKGFNRKQKELLEKIGFKKVEKYESKVYMKWYMPRNIFFINDLEVMEDY